ncbi:GBP5-like protein, partial [Mya arenaria]
MASNENQTVSSASVDLKMTLKSFEHTSKVEPAQIRRKNNPNKAPSRKRPGFAIGDTILSTTKGIWVWCRDHPEQKDTVLILLDTEGLGDVEKTCRRDFRLLPQCSCLISTVRNQNNSKLANQSTD